MASPTRPPRALPRSVSVAAEIELPPIHQQDIGVFWDLRRYHLGADVVSVESIVLALKYRAGLIKNFCHDWLGLGGLNVLVRFSVVCDLPSDAALEVQRQQIIRVFDDLEMQFCNIGGHTNPAVARREGINRFVIQFKKDYPRPLLVVISDDLRLLKDVRENAGQCAIVPVICRSKRGRLDGVSRQFFNRILAENVAIHPWDVYFYETVMATMVQLKGQGYPRNCLQILYSRARDTGTLLAPLFSWVFSLMLELTTIHFLSRSVFRPAA
ncbi:hypothetical protein BV898_11019 [Hypsibius exemplaris]|uniref:NYN domain-containing protein n=1 Tax=Hypsibius exemplaris TaxID=2072580 RepID=A0A1W0WHT1_HYPEX|nr:hypothetical protein BV898_11019 [Hypsibius exemplaris]